MPIAYHRNPTAVSVHSSGIYIINLASAFPFVQVLATHGTQARQSLRQRGFIGIDTIRFSATTSSRSIVNPRNSWKSSSSHSSVTSGSSSRYPSSITRRPAKNRSSISTLIGNSPGFRHRAQDISILVSTALYKEILAGPRDFTNENNRIDCLQRGLIYLEVGPVLYEAEFELSAFLILMELMLTSTRSHLVNYNDLGSSCQEGYDAIDGIRYLYLLAHRGQPIHIVTISYSLQHRCLMVLIHPVACM